MAVTAAQAKRWAVAATVVGTGLAALVDLREGDGFDVRRPIGAFVVGGVLTLTAEPAPKLTAAFAATMLLTAVFITGGPAIEAVATALTTPPRESSNES